jgi:hypothetical protein
MTRRLAEARALLERRGVSGSVDAVGIDDEIVAVRGPVELLEPLARLAPELRGLGFRYVALEPEGRETEHPGDS